MGQHNPTVHAKQGQHHDLKVRGTKHDSRDSELKKFLYPYFSKCGGTSKQISVLNTLKFAVSLSH